MLICGNENQGIGDEVKDFLGTGGMIQSVFIPSQASENSFNVSFAVYSAAFERYRQSIQNIHSLNT